MGEIDERTLREIEREGESLLVTDMVSLIERHHSHDGPGISRETLNAYVEALEASADVQIDPEAFAERVESVLTDSASWVDDDHLYELDSDRISRYPRAWHDRLGGTADVREYVAFLQDEVPSFKDDVGRGGAGPGIPKQPLLDVVATVGRVDRDEAKARLESLRDRGVLAEDADQHPMAGVVLRERHDEYRDSTLDR